MPKASVHKYDQAAGWEYDVRGSWEAFVVQAIAISERVQGSPHLHFRSGVRLPHPAHDLASIHGALAQKERKGHNRCAGMNGGSRHRDRHG